jgi:hypothetical protein
MRTEMMIKAIPSQKEKFTSWSSPKRMAAKAML